MKKAQQRRHLRGWGLEEEQPGHKADADLPSLLCRESPDLLSGSVVCLLPTLEHISSSWRTKVIIGDPSHPAHLFDLLHSGRRFRSIKSHTSRLTNSSFPWAIRAANNPHLPERTILQSYLLLPSSTLNIYVHHSLYIAYKRASCYLYFRRPGLFLFALFFNFLTLVVFLLFFFVLSHVLILVYNLCGARWLIGSTPKFHCSSQYNEK